MNSSTLRKCGVLQFTLKSPPWFPYTSTFHIGIIYRHSFQCKSRTWLMTEEMTGLSGRWSHRPSTVAGLGEQHGARDDWAGTPQVLSKSFICPINVQLNCFKMLKFTLRFTINAHTCFGLTLRLLMSHTNTHTHTHTHTHIYIYIYIYIYIWSAYSWCF